MRVPWSRRNVPCRENSFLNGCVRAIGLSAEAGLVDLAVEAHAGDAADDRSSETGNGHEDRDNDARGREVTFADEDARKTVQPSQMLKSLPASALTKAARMAMMMAHSHTAKPCRAPSNRAIRAAT